MPSPTQYKHDLLQALLSGATIKCGLLDSSASYDFTSATDSHVADLPTGQEPSDASYSRQELTNITFEKDDPDNEGVLDADDVTFPSLNTTNDIQAIFFYQEVGGDATTPADDLVLAVYDDTSAGSLEELPLPTNGSDVTITLDAEGLLNVT